jgi:hypothetical protein
MSPLLIYPLGLAIIKGVHGHLLKHSPAAQARRGIQGGRRHPPNGRKAVWGVARPQGVSGQGRAGPHETLGSPWIPLHVRACCCETNQHQNLRDEKQKNRVIILDYLYYPNCFMWFSVLLFLLFFFVFDFFFLFSFSFIQNFVFSFFFFFRFSIFVVVFFSFSFSSRFVFSFSIFRSNLLCSSCR